ncbi:hypothetical protein GPALN_003779 [Globodera pallida]|nr:hypothetical protein GPALN_003779 [Globodera pallida]
MLAVVAVICTFPFMYPPMMTFVSHNAGLSLLANGMLLVVQLALMCCEAARRSFPTNIILLGVLAPAAKLRPIAFVPVGATPSGRSHVPIGACFSLATSNSWLASSGKRDHMGYEQGQGLGKHNQGIVEPLQVNSVKLMIRLTST